MKIRNFKSVQASVYTVSVSTEEWSEGDRKLMADFGEPAVNQGGTFEADELNFTLPDLNVRIMTGVPISMGFDARDHADAEARALLWLDTLVQRITDAVVALRERTDTFTGETLINV